MSLTRLFADLVRKTGFRQLVFCLGLAVLACAPQPQRLFAAGQEVSLRGEDLNIGVDYRWAGCARGGYYPIRIKVTNLGAEREVTFRFRPFDNGLPETTRTVGLKPNATLQFSLSVPMVGDEGGGMLHVAQNGRRIESLDLPINLSDPEYSQFDRPAMLVISNSAVDVDQFEEGVNSLSAATLSSHGGYYGVSRTSDHEVIPPLMLPERWIDYTGLDFVSMNLKTLEGLPTETRQAILGWTRTGGNLLIYDVKDNRKQLEQLLELSALASQSGEAWNSPQISVRRFVNQVNPEDYGGRGYGGPVAVEAQDESESTEIGQGTFQWSDESPFVSRDYLQGKVIAFDDSPYPGTRHDWAWLLNTLGETHYQWSKRQGMSARNGNTEFLHFLIPGISGVPVFAFLVLITIFTIVIGPLNYFFLAKRKRLYLLVLSIPAIAFATSLSLFGYSVVAHGFEVKSRVRSLTIVDQGAQKAITDSRISLYAGLAPSDGLQFTAETAVNPVWPQHAEETFDGGSVNWTNNQSLPSGFIKSRTRTQFYNVNYRDERGRLQIDQVNGNSLKVSNGFETRLAQLLVRGPDGRLYYGENIAAGDSANLTVASQDQISSLTGELREHRPGLPENITSQSQSYSRRSWNYRHEDIHTQFSNNLMERELSELAKSVEQTIKERTYYGYFSENPGVNVGTDGVNEVEGLHAILGYY